MTKRNCKPKPPPPANNVKQTPQNVRIGLAVENGLVVVNLSPAADKLALQPQDAMQFAQALGNAAQQIMQAQAEAQPRIIVPDYMRKRQ